MAKHLPEYTVECIARSGTAVLRGVMRLEHEEARERVLGALRAALAGSTAEPYTIDVREVVFMNSSAFRALASVVLEAKKARRRLAILGRSSIPWQDRTLSSLSPLYDGVEIRMVSRTTGPMLRREGELWAIETAAGQTLRFKDSKGFAYLDRLLAEPDGEIHVLEIVGAPASGDAGAVLDARAKSEYAKRLGALRNELEEAEGFHDGARAERLREEAEKLTAQLAQAVGLGGRDRRASSDVERARVNVQRCLKEALDRIDEADPALGRYFAATVKTGTFCSFRPL